MTTDDALQFDLRTILAVTHSPAIDDEHRPDLVHFLLRGRRFPENTHGAAVREACAERILDLYPGLRRIPTVPVRLDDDAAAQWITTQRAKYSNSLPLSPLPRLQLAELMYEQQASAWDVRAEGALARTTLPTYATNVKHLLDYAATTVGLAAAVRWTAEQSGTEAADALTRHMLRSMAKAVTPAEDDALFVQGLEQQLGERPGH